MSRAATSVVVAVAGTQQSGPWTELQSEVGPDWPPPPITETELRVVHTWRGAPRETLTVRQVGDRCTTFAAPIVNPGLTYVVFLGPETPVAWALHGGLFEVWNGRAIDLNRFGPEGAAAARAPMALSELEAAVTSA